MEKWRSLTLPDRSRRPLSAKPSQARKPSGSGDQAAKRRGEAHDTGPGTCAVAYPPAHPPSAMRTYTPLIYACALSVIPTARPLLAGRPAVVSCGHWCGARTALWNKNKHDSLRRRSVGDGATAVAMMSKPSQPVPRNIKDTVSSLRAAVQVQQ